MPESARPWTRRQREAARAVRPIGASENSGIQERTTTTPCSTKGSGSGSLATVRSMITRTSANKDPTIRTAKLFPAGKVGTPGSDARSQDDEVQLYQHPGFATSAPSVRAYDANDTLWLSGTRSGLPVGIKPPRCSTETGDAAKSPKSWNRPGSCCDTNGNRQARRLCRANARSIRTRTKRIVPGSGPYAVDSRHQSTARSGHYRRHLRRHAGGS